MHDPRKPPILVLGRYALYDAIASGGMASVHLGRLTGQVGFARTVAIKRLHPHYAAEPEFVSMFLDEARLAGRIQHPNVVMTLDVVTEATELFLVMEYVQGEALHRLLRSVMASGGFVPPRVAVAIVCDVLQGLCAAHEARSESGQPLGIVHRDVSPQNVLVGVDGVARVLDFGIAKAVSRLQTTEEGQLKGKLAYMSPEQLFGQEVDLRTDVWASSVLLWETLTCQRLFLADSQAEIFGKVQKGDVEAPTARMPAPALAVLPEATRAALDAVVLRGLARGPEHRFQSASAMAGALEECLPAATRAQVAAWVQENAREALAVRSEALREIEQGVELSRQSSPEALLSALRASSPSAPGQVHEAPNDDNAATLLDASATDRPPPSRVFEKLVRWRRIAVGLAAAMLLVGGLVLGAVLLRHRRIEEPAAPPPPAAKPPPRAVTEWPPPKSVSGEALSAYAAGLQAMRDGSSDAAQENFARAGELDPQFGAAHLRLAVMQAEYGSLSMDARTSFSKSAQLKTTLSDRDAALEAAFEPILQGERPDVDLWETRMSRSVLAHPEDAELFFYQGFFRRQLGRIEEAREPLRRAATLDPRFGLALGTLAEIEVLLGHEADANALVERCLGVSSTGSDCLWVHAIIDEQSGACAHEESDARTWITRVPSDGYAYYMLAQALAAQDRPFEAVREALRRKWSQGTAPWQRGTDQARLHILYGDFASAEIELKAVEALEPLPPACPLAVARELLAEIYLETSRPAAARAVLEQIVSSQESWISLFAVDDTELALDPFPRAFAILSRLGASPQAEARAQKEAWVKGWGTRLGFFENALWIWAHARPSETRADAEEALAKLPGFEPLPPSPQTEAPAAIGHAYFLAGRTAEALPFLRKGAASCRGLIFPFDQVRSLFELGQSLEASDRAGACAAYERLLWHWGSAKPKSSTAITVRARMSAAACAPLQDR